MTVPEDLRSEVGLREIRYSLRTRSRRKAKSSARKMAGFVHQVFDDLRVLRRREGMSVELTEGEIKRLLRKHFKELLEEDEKKRVLNKRTEYDLYENRDSEVMSLVQSDCMEELARSDHSRVTSYVNGFLEDKAIELDRDSFSYKKLCREMLKLTVNHLEVELRRDCLNYSLDNLPFPDLSPTGPILQRPRMRRPQPEEKKDSPIVSEVAERLVAEKKRTGEWTREKTEVSFRAACDLFIEILGDDVPVDKVDRRTVDEYKQTLMQLPPNRKKLKKYRDKTINEILAMDVEKTLANDTVNNNLRWISELFSYAENCGMVAKNPASGMQLGKGKRTDPPRESFTDEDLRKLFHTDLYLKDQHRNSYSFWVPIIALFTGARIEEICQLHLDDIKQEEGIWVFDINYGDEKKVKTEAGERFIPIHPFLLNDLKIVQYAESLREGGEKRLFPELTLQRDGYSQRVSKWFGRYKKECGIKSRKKVFHSFRHTLIDVLKQNGEFNPIMHKELVGHVVDDMTYGRYAGRYKPDKVYEIIKNVKYDVDLSHLTKSRFIVC